MPRDAIYAKVQSMSSLVIRKIDMFDLDRRPTSWTLIREIDMLDLDALTGPVLLFAVITFPFQVSSGGVRGFGFDAVATFEEGETSLINWLSGSSLYIYWTGWTYAEILQFFLDCVRVMRWAFWGGTSWKDSHYLQGTCESLEWGNFDFIRGYLRLDL